MSDPGARPSPALRMGSFGVAIAWRGPLGPAVACFDAWSRRAPRFVRGLGRPGAALASPVALAAGDGGLRVAWCEGDGGWVATVDLASPATVAPELALPGARRVALTSGWLFGADGRGVVARPDGGPVQRVLHERRAGLELHATSLRDEAVVVFTHPGDRWWGVIAVPRRGAPVVVRHALREPCTGVRVRAVSGRAAALIGLADGGVRLAIIGAGGRVIERPHRVFAQGEGPLDSADVVWTQDRWTALARRARDDTLVVQPIGKGEGFTLPRCTGPFAACAFSDRLYALEVDPSAGGAELRLWRTQLDGGRAQQRVVEVTLDDAADRRVGFEARRTLRALADRIETAADYRSSAARARLDRDGVTLRLDAEDGHLALGVIPGPDGRVTLEVTRSRAGAPVEPAPRSLRRLARWVRERLSPDARVAADRRAAWAEALAAPLGARVSEVDAADGHLTLRLALPTVPDPETLDRWIRRLRESAVG